MAVKTKHYHYRRQLRCQLAKYLLGGNETYRSTRRTRLLNMKQSDGPVDMVDRY